MKRADVEKVRHSWVGFRVLARAPRYGGGIIRPVAWRGHARCGELPLEGCLAKNKGGEIKVGVCDLALQVFLQD